MNLRRTHILLILLLSGSIISAQEMASSLSVPQNFSSAKSLAYEGNHRGAQGILERLLGEDPNNPEVLFLLARTHSWDGNYKLARKEFNRITSVHRNSGEFWRSAIKNELYAGNYPTALGLSNKALSFLDEDAQISELKTIALFQLSKTAPSVEDNSLPVKETEPPAKEKNAISVSNAVMVFDMIYDPMVYSSIEYKRQTRFGSLIPRINYSHRFNTNGIQYDLDLYPKLAKRVYAYLNYGYSQASIYPNHKVGGDVYMTFPWAMEFSAGMRYIDFDARNVSVVTNSLGLYKGNYYFSLRSYITPKSNQLTRVSGNLLVRKYFKDAENFLGVSAGMGFSPEIRQLVLDGTVLSETLLYLESQRANMDYQFTGKSGPNVYRTSLGIARQELVTSPGDYYFSVIGGFTYRVKF